MEEPPILYYDGSTARPTEVRVRLLSDQLHLYQGGGENFIQSFPLSGMAYNQVGNTHYLYLDQRGLQYLQFTATHPLALSMQKQVAGANPHWGQKLMQQRTAVLLCLLVILGTGLYFGVVSLVPFIGCRMIGVEQEIQMGNRMKEVMLNEAGMLGAKVDTTGTRKLQAFADQLQLSTHYPIKLTLVSSDIVNAYALPGGQVVVYSGILEKINSPEALAALLAHESSHVNERHSLRSLLRNAANGIIVAVVFNDATGISGALVSNANTLNGLRYSRSLEAEADKKGMDLLVSNEVNVNGMQELMQTLQKEGDLPGSLSFLSTHPLTKERIEETKRYIQNHPQEIRERADLKSLFESLKQSSE